MPFHIAHQSVMQSMRQAGQNQEMPQFTQGVCEAKNHVWGEHARLPETTPRANLHSGP